MKLRWILVKSLIKNPSRRLKNTNCPFSLSIKFKRDRSSELGSIIEMVWTHNHPVKVLQSLSFSDINGLTSQRIKELFEKVYSPSLAYKESIRELRLQCESDMDFHIKMSDRSRLQWRNDFVFLSFHRSTDMI